MVKHLLDQIMSPNTELKTEVNICGSSHSFIFFKESTYLSTVVARIYPSVNPSSGRFRERSIYTDGHGDRGDGRCGHFNGRGRGRGRGGRGDEGEEETAEEVVEEAAAHMKMELTSHMSPVTLKIQIRPYSQTI